MYRFENITAVIVEDDPFISMDLQGILEDSGISVVDTCASLDDALDAAQTQTADIFTLDYELGADKSDSVAKTLKSSDTPFIVISGKIELLSTKPQFLNVPMLSKPVDPEALIRAIKEVVN